MSFDSHYLVRYGAEVCAQLLPRSEFRDLYGALLCGQPLESSARALFLDTGLIHLMVVSGAHLHFMESWLKWLPSRVRLLVIGLYCWLTGFGPPVVRAWVRRLADVLLVRWKGSPFQVELAALTVLLMILPGWLLSRSFLMSWLCAIAICLPPLFPRWPNLSLSFLCYLLLFPFCPSAPSTLFCNVLVTPLIGALLFPICALAVAIPPLVPLVDELWRIFLAGLEHLPAAPPAAVSVFSPWLFLYPLSIHVFLLFAEVPWRRSRAFSP
jgi:ComEC/Rec2-related protein